MNTPLVLLCGQAGSGKDAVAEMLVKNHGAAAVAQADPMKRLGYYVFRFSEQQLWGPSELRNAVDTRFVGKDNLQYYELLKKNSQHFVNTVLPNLSDSDKAIAQTRLEEWGAQLLRETEKDGGLSPRKMLQTLGTEWGRMFEKDMWANFAKNIAFKLLGGGFGYSRVSGLYPDSHNFPNVVVITDGRFRNEIVSVTAVGGEAWKVVNPVASETPGIKGHASESEQMGIPNHFYKSIIHNDKSKGLDKLAYMVDWIYNDRVVHDVSRAYNYTIDKNGGVNSFSYLWDKLDPDDV